MSTSKALEPSIPQCGAKLRNRDAFCRQPAGARTNHPGTGRCWIHGGLTPVRHGRYSSVVRREIQELLRELEQDPNPLNILPDLLMVRALLADFLNRYEENREAVLAWHASWNGRPWRTEDLKHIREVLDAYEGRMREDGTWDDEDGVSVERADLERAQLMMLNMAESFSGRPREVLDIADAYRMASEATKIVERIEKIRSRGAISREDFARVMTEMGRTIEAGLSPAKVRVALSKAGVDPLPEEAVMVTLADDLRNTLVDLLMTIRVV